MIRTLCLLATIGLWCVSVPASAVAQEWEDFRPDLPVGARTKIEVSLLAPTQFSVGRIEVEDKIERLWDMDDDEVKEYLREREAPVVIGPENRPYIVDQHHLSLAVLESGVKKRIYAKIIANWRNVDIETFWRRMKERKWVYLYDQHGRLRSQKSLPKTLRGLRDDPYRSLAWGVREEGGFQKTSIPFSEFQWANFFRTRVPRYLIQEDFDEAVERALEFAHSRAAQKLPGFIDCLDLLR